MTPEHRAELVRQARVDLKARGNEDDESNRNGRAFGRATAAEFAPDARPVGRRSAKRRQNFNFVGNRNPRKWRQRAIDLGADFESEIPRYVRRTR